MEEDIERLISKKHQANSKKYQAGVKGTKQTIQVQYKQE